MKLYPKAVLATLYDPRLPSLQPIQAKHWRSMVSQNQYLAEVFPQPPLPQWSIMGQVPEKKNVISEKSSGKFYFDILTMKIYIFLFSDPYKLVKIMFCHFGP